MRMGSSAVDSLQSQISNEISVGSGNAPAQMDPSAPTKSQSPGQFGLGKFANISNVRNFQAMPDLNPRFPYNMIQFRPDFFGCINSLIGHGFKNPFRPTADPEPQPIVGSNSKYR